jgi:hypothetical protein
MPVMPDKNELTKRYASYSNERLLDILYNKQEYTLEAMEMVQAEIATRQIVVDEVKAFVEDKEFSQVIAREKSLLTLNFFQKVFFFFAWFVPGFIAGAFSMNFADDGFTGKLRQSRFFRITGFISALMTGFMGVWWELSNVSGWILLFGLFGLAYFLSTKIVRIE